MTGWCLMTLTRITRPQLKSKLIQSGAVHILQIKPDSYKKYEKYQVVTVIRKNLSVETSNIKHSFLAYIRNVSGRAN